MKQFEIVGYKSNEEMHNVIIRYHDRMNLSEQAPVANVYITTDGIDMNSFKLFVCEMINLVNEMLEKDTTIHIENDVEQIHQNIIVK